MAITLKTVVDLARVQLKEPFSSDESNSRWKTPNLIEWANGFYDLVALNLPHYFSSAVTQTLAAGTRQNVPAEVVVLLDVTRNMEGGKRAVTRVRRDALDKLLPDWHNEEEGVVQEHWCYDEQHPRIYYVFPPAAEGSTIELIGSVAPTKHIEADYSGNAQIKVPDKLSQAMIDYLLYRAYGMDSEDTVNANLAATYYNSAMSQMGMDSKIKAKTSPNNPVNNQ